MINTALKKRNHTVGTPQPLYNTIVGVHSINRVNRQLNNHVISKQKCIDDIEK